MVEEGWHQPDRSQSTQVPIEGLASAVGYCMSLSKTKIKAPGCFGTGSSAVGQAGLGTRVFNNKEQLLLSSCLAAHDELFSNSKYCNTKDLQVDNCVYIAVNFIRQNP